MRLMSLGVRQGDRVTVTAEGGREDEAIAAMEAIFRAHL
jgi:phosphotransferase system HPr (HPr) family protein